MADAFAPLTAKLDRYARALRLTGPDARTFAQTVGPILDAEIDVAARAAFGQDLRPFKDKAVKATWATETEQLPNGIRIRFKLRPEGIWAFGQWGSKPHRIGQPAGSQTRFGKIARAGAAHPVRGVDHPGHRGKGAIHHVYKRIRSTQMKAVRAGIGAVFEQVQRG